MLAPGLLLSQISGPNGTAAVLGTLTGSHCWRDRHKKKRDACRWRLKQSSETGWDSAQTSLCRKKPSGHRLSLQELSLQAPFGSDFIAESCCEGQDGRPSGVAGVPIEPWWRWMIASRADRGRRHRVRTDRRRPATTQHGGWDLQGVRLYRGMGRTKHRELGPSCRATGPRDGAGAPLFNRGVQAFRG